MLKVILYKPSTSELVRGNRITITDRDGKVTVSIYIDFVKSGLSLFSRMDCSFLDLESVYRSYIKYGFKVIKYNKSSDESLKITTKRRKA